MVRQLSCVFSGEVFGTPWLVLRWLPSHFLFRRNAHVKCHAGCLGWSGRTLMSQYVFRQDIPLFRLHVSAMDAYAFEVSLLLFCFCVWLAYHPQTGLRFS